MNKVRLYCIERGNNKLQFVKLLRNYTGLGLSECKDLCDLLDYPKSIVDFELLEDKSIEDFKRDIKDITGDYLVNGGKEFNREFKLLKLGIGNREDYINFVIQNNEYFDKQELIKIFLRRFDKNELIEIMNEFEQLLF